MSSQRGSLVGDNGTVGVRTPDAKRRRLSLLPPHAKLGAPRLLNGPKRQSQTPELADAVLRAVARNTSRRASRLPSSAAGQPGGSTPLPRVAAPRDPRPLRDASVQNEMQTALLDYLSLHNFDTEMNYPLSQRALRSPTQKEFVLMFQWLYNRIDPGYKFVRSIEQEVYSLLKLLEYPYLDTINKSQISAVGGSNWHVFLGMLYWLLKLVLETSKYDGIELGVGDGNLTPVEESMTVGPEPIDNLFVSYALKSYKAFLTYGEDNYDQYLKEMERDYNAYMQSIDTRMTLLRADSDRLHEQLTSTQRKETEFLSQLDRSKALQTDVAKFQNYIDVQTQRRQRWPQVISKLQADITNIKTSIQDIEREKKAIVEDLAKRNFTLSDIEKLHKDRAVITAELNNLDLTQQKLRNRNEAAVKDLTTKVASLNSLIKSYNAKVESTVADLTLSEPLDVTLTIEPLSTDYAMANLGMAPSQIMPNLVSLKESLQNVKVKVTAQWVALQDETLALQVQLDDLHLALVAQKDSLETATSNLKSVRSAYDTLSERHQTDSTNKQLEIDARTAEIASLNTLLATQSSALETKWLETQQNLRSKSAQINEARSSLTLALAERLDTIVTLKGHIITDLDKGLHALDL